MSISLKYITSLLKMASINQSDLPIQCSNLYQELGIHRAPIVSTATGFVPILRKET